MVNNFCYYLWNIYYKILETIQKIKKNKQNNKLKSPKSLSIKYSSQMLNFKQNISFLFKIIFLTKIVYWFELRTDKTFNKMFKYKW